MKKHIQNAIGIFALAAFLMVGCDTDAQGNGGQGNGAAQSATAVSVQNVNIDKFEQLLKEDGMQVLDVRTPGEVAEGMVEHAAHININGSDFSSRANSELDKNKPVAVYCKSGGRSSRAAQSLVDLGFTKVYNYTGGMTEWVSKGKPTVTQ